MRTFKDGKIILQNLHSGMFLQLFDERNEQSIIVQI